MEGARRLRKHSARFALATAAVLLLSVSGVTEDQNAPQKSVHYSDWQGAHHDAETTQRVGSFKVGKPETEKFVGGLFDEWRDVILPEFGGFDRRTRQTVRDKLFFNRDAVDFNEYLAQRRESVLLRLNQASADYFTDGLVNRAEGEAAGLSFIRSVNIDYQSGLAGRRWQSGINVMGALRETTDSAIAWQLRSYAAEDDALGSNVGLIYRHVVGERGLVGLNVFLDYEDHEHGEFFRWSYGGELRGSWGGIYANQYIGITDDQWISDDEVAYTQDGLDVAVDISFPRYQWLSGGLTYYSWKGKYGEADDKGLRHRLGFDFSHLMGGGDFWGGVAFDVEYDKPQNGEGDWGGNVSYIYRFGNASPGGGSPTEPGFDPRAHFFDPVRREYAQRIRVARPRDDEQVLVTLMGDLAVINSGSPITLQGEVTTATYPFLVTTTISTGANSQLNLHLERKTATSTLYWSAILHSDTEVVSEGGSKEEGGQLELVRGAVDLDRNGVVSVLSSPSVTVRLLGTRLRMTYPYPAGGGVSLTRVEVREGMVEIEVATVGLLATPVLVGEQATAVVIQGGIRTTVNYLPAPDSVLLSTVPVLMGQSGDMHMLSLSGYRAGTSLRYRLDNPPDGWTVENIDPISAVIKLSSSVGITAPITISAYAYEERSVPYGPTISWEVIFEPKASVMVSVPPGPVNVVTTFSGVIHTVSVNGDLPHTFTLPADPAGFSVNDSGVVAIVSAHAVSAGETVLLAVSVRGALGSMDSVVVTVIGATDLTLTYPASVYTVRLGETPALLTMAVSGGDGNYSYLAEPPLAVGGAGAMVTVGIGTGQTEVGTRTVAVAVSDGAVGRSVTAVLFTIQFYSPVSFESPVSVAVGISVTVAQFVYTAKPGEGSGKPLSFVLNSVEPSSVSVVVNADSGRVSLVSELVEMLTLSVVIQVTDSGTGEQATQTLLVVGEDRPVAILRPAYYRKEGEAMMLTLDIFGGTPPYAVEKISGVDAFSLSDNTVVAFAGAAMAGVYELSLRITDQDPKTVTAVVIVSVYSPLSGSEFPQFEVAEDYTGVLGTVSFDGGLPPLTYRAVDYSGSSGILLSVNVSTGVFYLTTTLAAGVFHPGKVSARDSRGDTAEVDVFFQGVGSLSFAALPTLYVPVGTGVGATIASLSATGGAGEEIEYGVASDVNGRVSVNGAELILATAPSGEATEVVSLQAAYGGGVINSPKVVAATMRFYDGLGFESASQEATVQTRITGVVSVVSVSPTGGSRSYSLTIVSVNDDSGRTLGLSLNDDNALVLTATLGTTLGLSVLIRVSDTVLTALAPATMTVALVGLDSLLIFGTENADDSQGFFYASTGKSRPFVLATLSAVGTDTYEWGAGPDSGTNVRDLLTVVSSGDDMATVSVTGVPATLGLKIWNVTVGDGAGVVEGADGALKVYFYDPISLRAPNNPVNVMEDFTGTLTVLHIHGGTDSEPQIGYQAVVTSGAYADHFATAFVVGSVNFHDGGRFSVPVYLDVVATVAEDFVAVVSMTVSDGILDDEAVIVLTIQGGNFFSQRQPLGEHVLAPGQTCISCPLVTLNDYYERGELPYSYEDPIGTVVYGGSPISLVIDSSTVLILRGIAPSSGKSFTATVLATDSVGEITLTSAITVHFANPMAFSPSLVTHTIAVGHVGAVYRPMATEGSGRFAYSVQSPAFGAGGRQLALSGGATVSLATGLQADEVLTMTITARDMAAYFAGEMAVLTVVLEAGVASASFAPVWYPTLRSGDGGLAVAGLSVAVMPMVTASVAGTLFRATATEDGGVALWAGALDAAGTMVATMAVWSRLPGWNTLTVRHTVVWVAVGNEGGIIMVGGNESTSTGETGRADTWKLGDGGVWTRLCDDCFSGDTGGVEGGRLFTHEGSLWLVEGDSLERQYLSGDGGENWTLLTLGEFPDSAFLSFGGTLWGFGGFAGNESVFYFDPALMTMIRVTARISGFPGGTNGYMAVEFGGSVVIVGGSYNVDSVLASGDGLVWDTLVPGGGFGHVQPWNAALAVHSGSLFLYGGNDSNWGDAVWASANGGNWVSVGALSPKRQKHQMFSHDGNLWIVGGEVHGAAATMTVAEVWRSADGASWTKDNDAAFGARTGHRILSYEGEDSPVPRAGVQASDLSARYVRRVGTAAPVTLDTVNFSGGVGAVSVAVGGCACLTVVSVGTGRAAIVLSSVPTVDMRFSATVFLRDETANVVEQAFLAHVFEPVEFDPDEVTVIVPGNEFGRTVPLPRRAIKGSGRYIYRVVTNALDGSGSVPVAAAGSTVISIGIDPGDLDGVRVNVKVTDADPAYGGEANLLVKIEGVSPVTAEFRNRWRDRLRVGDGDLAVASVRVSGYPSATVSLVGDAFEYVTTRADGSGHNSRHAPLLFGGLLRAKVQDSAGRRAATLLVWSTELPAMPTLTLVHAVEWIASRGDDSVAMMMMVGGYGLTEAGQVGRDDIWITEDGIDWVRLCDYCWGDAERYNDDLGVVAVSRNLQQQVSGANVGGGTLWLNTLPWVFGSTDNGRSWTRLFDGFNSRDSRGLNIFDTNTRAAALGGTVWAVNAYNVINYFDYENLTVGAVATVNAEGAPLEIVSFNGSLFLLGGEASQLEPNDEVWASADGRSWGRLTNAVAFAANNRAERTTEVEVHNGSLFLVGGFNQWSPTVWASADGADWRNIGTFPTGGPSISIDDHELVSFKGSLWLVGGKQETAADVTIEEEGYFGIWRSADGVSWTEVAASGEPAFGNRGEHDIFVIDGRVDDYFLPPVAGIMVADGSPSSLLSPARTTVPMTVATVTVLGCIGNCAATLVSGNEALGVDVDIEGRVFVVMDGTVSVGTTMTATLRVVDQTTEGADWVLTVGFYAPVGFATARVTQEVGAGLIGGVYSPRASDGSGVFLYSVVSPGVSSGGRSVTMAMAEGMVSLATTLGVGEMVTVTVVARENSAGYVGEANLILVLNGVEVGASFSEVWFGRLRTGDGDVAVARLTVLGMRGVTVGVSDALFSYVPDGDEPDRGGVLRIGTSSAAGARAVTLLVSSSSDANLPTLTVAFTVVFVASRSGAVSRLVMVDGETRTASGGNINDIWFSEDGETWTQGCVDNCFWKVGSNVNSPQNLYKVVYQDGALWALGTYAFRSRDGGLSWRRVSDLPPVVPAEGRVRAQYADEKLVSHRGTLWRLDGARGPSQSNIVNYLVWDGYDAVVGLVSLNPPIPGATGGYSPRKGHAVVSFKGSLWFVGGENSNLGYDGFVWSSADGRAWEEVVATAAFGPRQNHAMAVHGGSLYVYGGTNSGGFADNFVWSSGDGADWGVAGTMLVSLHGHEMISYRGSLWIIGGSEDSSSSTDLRGGASRIWRSADGASWELATADAGFPGRAFPGLVSVRLDAEGTLPPRTAISMEPEAPALRFVNLVAETAPVDVATAVIFGGAGAYEVSLISDSGLPAVGLTRGGDEAVVRLTGFGAAGSRLTVTMRVRGSTPGGRMADWVLTVGFYDPVSFDPSLVTQVVGADTTGAVFVPMATDGSGNFAYSVVSPGVSSGGRMLTVSGGATVMLSTALMVDELLTVSVVAREVAEGFDATGEATLTLVLLGVARSASFVESWYERFRVGEGNVAVASLQIVGYEGVTVDVSGEDGLWSFEPAGDGGGLLRAGAASSAGVRTVSVLVSSAMQADLPTLTATYTVAWVAARSGSVTMAVMVGGLSGGNALSDVWGSEDGTVWTELCDDCFYGGGQWKSRLVAHRGSLWVFGNAQGRDSGGGVSRAGASSYRSGDGGRTWEFLDIIPGTGISERSDAQFPLYKTAVLNGTVWFTGGPNRFLNQVYYYSEADDRLVLVAGRDSPSPDSSFAGRSQHFMESFNGSLIVFAGLGGTGFTNDAWASADGVNWTQLTTTLPFASVIETGGRSAVYNGTLFFLNGNTDDAIWYSTDGAAWTNSGSFRPGPGQNNSSIDNTQLFSYAGTLWYHLQSDDGSNQQIWHSTNGTSWSRLATAPAYGPRTGQAFAVLEGAADSLLAPVTPGFSAADGFPSLAFVTVGTGTPLAVATLSFSGGIGTPVVTLVADSDSLAVERLVGQGQAVVNLSALGAAGEWLTATLRVRDETPDSMLERVLTVGFYEGFSFVPAMTTRAIAPGFTGAVYTVSASGASGAFSYEVVSPAYRAGGEMVAVSGSGGVVRLDGNLPAGEALSITVRATETNPDRTYPVGAAEFVLVLGAVTASFSEIWFSKLRSGEGDRAVASLQVSYYPTVSVAIQGDSLLWEYVPAENPNEGGLLRVGLHSAGDLSLEASLVVSDPTGNLPPTTVTHAVRWFGTEEKMFLIGGAQRVGSGSQANKKDVWISADGENWTKARHEFRRFLFEHSAASHDGKIYVAGGFAGTTDDKNLYESEDGRSWLERSGALPATGSSKGYHEMAFHGGSLWLVGGRTRDNAASAIDKVYYREGNFFSEAAGSPGFAARSRHALVSFSGSLLVIGGLGTATGAAGRLRDVWASENGGFGWEQLTATAAFPEGIDYQAAVHKGSLYLNVGTGNNSNEIWASDNGKDWVRRGTLPAPVPTHFQMVSFKGSLWNIGGAAINTDWNDASDDIWRSADGTSWTPVTLAAPFGGRQAHQVVVLESFPAGAPEPAALQVDPDDFPAGGNQLIAGRAIPDSFRTIDLDDVSGGRGEKSFELFDDKGLLYLFDVGAQNEYDISLTATIAVGEVATMTLRITDETPDNVVDIVFRISFAGTTGFLPGEDVPGEEEQNGRFFVAMAGFSPASERVRRFRGGHLVYNAGFMGWNEREL